MTNTYFGHSLPRAAGVVLCFGMLVTRLCAQVGPPPVILTQPESLAVPYGDPASFAVTVSSTTYPTFKWYKNGSAVPSAIRSTLTIDRAVTTDAGIYFVEVRNASGSVTSSNATLTVEVPPATCASPRMTTNGFNFQVQGPTGVTFVVLVSSNMTDWMPVFTNSAPTGSLNFTDTTAASRSFKYYRAVIQ